MIEFMHWDGRRSIECDDNENVIVSVENNDSLLRLIRAELSKGIPNLKEFKNNGIPGKIKAFKKIKTDKDIVDFLEYMQKYYPQYGLITQGEEENQEINKRYTLLKWNGEYGEESKFIVRDNFTGMQSLFTPGRCDDLFWFYSDLANDKIISNWKDFGNESFNNLEPIAF